MTKKTANLNIKAFSNILIEYEHIDEVDKEQLMKDMLYFKNILNEYEQSASVTVKVPDNFVMLESCEKCNADFNENGVDYIFESGIAKHGANAGKVWYSMTCKHCMDEYPKGSGNMNPAKNFLKEKSNYNAPDTDTEIDTLGDIDIPF